MSLAALASAFRKEPLEPAESFLFSVASVGGFLVTGLGDFAEGRG